MSTQTETIIWHKLNVTEYPVLSENRDICRQEYPPREDFRKLFLVQFVSPAISRIEIATGFDPIRLGWNTRWTMSGIPVAWAYLPEGV